MSMSLEKALMSKLLQSVMVYMKHRGLSCFDTISSES